MKLFIVMCSNSPELAVDAGPYEIKGGYFDHEKAKAALSEMVEADKEFDFYPVETMDDYVVSYKNGDEKSSLWSEYKIEPVEVE